VSGEGKTSCNDCGMLLSQSCHAEVAEPQLNRSMQDLKCYPAFGSSASSRRGGGRILSNLIGGQTLNQVQGDKIVKNLFTSKKAAFTLAEVLITLAIIGVVAAMTIPTLISDYQEKVTITKLKKTYSVLSNALGLAIAENGSVDTWNYAPGMTPEGTRKFFDYIRPMLKIAKDCGGSNENKCITDDAMLCLNGSECVTAGWFYGANETYYKVVLNDGSALWTRTTVSCDQVDGEEENICALFWYDVNGIKAPNQLGRDTFVFYVKPYGVIPHTHDNCYLNDTGWGCAAYILKHGNMDYPDSK